MSEALRWAIEGEVFKVGERLPDRATLAKMFGVGECTVRAAQARLIAEKRLVSRQRLKNGILPDLIFVIDDFLTSGALAVIQSLGLRIPADVKVVSYVNIGSGFYYPQPFACIEFDPVADGKAVADCVLKWFRTGTFPADYASRPHYCRGSTFPVF